jgi:YD repeat-containing protein
MRPLGFGWRESLNEVNGILSRTDLMQNVALRGNERRSSTCLMRLDELPKLDPFPDDLCPQGGAALLPWGQKLTESQNCWVVYEGNISSSINEIRLPKGASCAADVIRTNLSGYTVRQIVLERANSYSYELDGQIVSSKNDGFEYDIGNTILDQHLNVLKTTSVLGDGTGVTTENTFADDVSRWFLGRLTTSTVTKVGDPIGGSLTKRKTEITKACFAYDAGTGTLTEQTANCHSAARPLKTTYARDQFGNVVGTTLSTFGAASQTTRTEYDALGRFVSALIDPMGHRASKDVDLRSGLPKVVNDLNGLSTTLEYDSFGRLQKRINPDGVVAETRLLRLADLPKTPDGDLLYAGVEASYASETRIGSMPPSFTLFDVKGRALRAVTEAFTKNEALTRFAYKDSRYDLMGNVVAVSVPYEPRKNPLWKVTDFDALGRVCRTVAANGLRTDTLYSGLAAGGGRVTVVVDPKDHLLNAAASLTASDGGCFGDSRKRGFESHQ